MVVGGTRDGLGLGGWRGGGLRYLRGLRIVECAEGVAVRGKV